MEIRSAHPSQAAELSQLAWAAKSHWGYVPEDLENWRPSLTVAAESMLDRPTYIADHQGAVVGFYQLAPLGAGIELDHFWVHPDHQRRGIGRQLLQHAAQHARALGHRSLHIDADPNAEGFYLACGAVRIGVLAAPSCIDPQRVRPQLRLATACGADDVFV